MDGSATAILRLDIAEETRTLTEPEHDLRSKLKKRLLGWAAIEKARKKQCSRITYLREGDANTRFFHLKANARKRKKLHPTTKERKQLGCNSHGQAADNPRSL